MASNGGFGFMLKMWTEKSVLHTRLIGRRNELSVYFLVNMDNASSSTKSGEVRELTCDVCSHPFPEAEELYQKSTHHHRHLHRTARGWHHVCGGLLQNQVNTSTASFPWAHRQPGWQRLCRNQAPQPCPGRGRGISSLYWSQMCSEEDLPNHRHWKLCLFVCESVQTFVHWPQSCWPKRKGWRDRVA